MELMGSRKEIVRQLSRRSAASGNEESRPRENKDAVPAERACRYARHAWTWFSALATQRHNDHFGTWLLRDRDQPRGTLPAGAAVEAA
jgi:hypothetical protein